MSNNLTNLTSISGTGLSLRAEPSVDHLERLWANQVQVDADGGKYLARPLDGDARTILEHRLHELERFLMPWRGDRERDRLVVALGSMLRGWGVNAGAMVASYCAALTDLPLWAIEQACDQITRGMIADLDPDFRPSAARVHAVVGENLLMLQRERFQIKQILEAPTKDEPKKTPDEYSRIMAGFKKLSDSIRGRTTDSDAAKREHTARAHRIGQQTDNEIAAEWRAHGVNVVPSHDGHQISLSLAKQIGLVKIDREAV